MPNWNEVLQEINDYIKKNAGDPERARLAVDVIRRKYLKALHDHTGRNVIAYYSGFLSKPTVAGLAMVIIMIPVLVAGIIIVGFMLVVTYDYT